MTTNSTSTDRPGGYDRRTVLKRAGQGAIGFTSLSAFLSACGGGSGGGGGGTRSAFRVGFATQEMDSLNPFVAQNAFSTFPIQAMFPMLVNLDGPDFDVVPDLASKWVVSDAGKTIRLTLRKGSWSDGKPITGADVKFTIDTIKKYADGPAGVMASRVAKIASVEVDGDDVVLHYSAPIATAMSDLARLPILPQQQWAAAATGDGKGLTQLRIDDTAISGGPFRLRRYREKEIVLLDRNPKFYGSAPHFQTLGFQFFSTQAAMLTALEAKRVDSVIRIDPQPKLDQLPKGLQVSQVDGFRIDYLAFNSNPKKPKHRELLDPRVRDALTQAIDTEAYVKTIFYGQAGRGGSFVPPACGDWHDPSVVPTSFDPEKAAAALDALGYKKGSDGIRRTPEGKMSYTLNAANDNASAARKAEVIQAHLREIGVEVKPKLLDAAAMFDAVSGPKLKYLSNDMHMWSWGAFPDPSELLSYLKSDQLGGNSDVAYMNKEYDALWKRQLAEVDEAKRREIVYAMQKIIARDKPYVVLSYPNQIEAHWSYVQHVQPTPNTAFNWLSKGPVLRSELAA
jgi:peptide/nickel transport system substrate-binding protein